MAIRFRCIEDHDCRTIDYHSKYDAPAGQGTRLYNVQDLLVDSPHIAICEGEIDTLTLSKMVGIPAVGVSGVSSWKEHHPRLFVNHDRIFVVFDNDEDPDREGNPGRAAAEKIARQLSNVTVVTLPPKVDVNEFYLAHGAEALRKRMGLE